MTAFGVIGGACDPNKATSCSKTHCAYLNRGDCRHTTNEEWIKEGVKRKWLTPQSEQTTRSEKQESVSTN